MRLILIVLFLAPVLAFAEEATPADFGNALLARKPFITKGLDPESLLIELNYLGTAARATAQACSLRRHIPADYAAALEAAQLSSTQLGVLFNVLDQAEFFSENAAVSGALTKLVFYKSMISVPGSSLPQEMFLP